MEAHLTAWYEWLAMPADQHGVPLARDDYLGGYRIVEKLGAGGMGVVYRAVQVQLNREVALKVLSPSARLGREARERFLQEARLAARVSDPCIVRVLDAGDERQLLFIVYELIHGPSARECLRERKRFPPAEAVAIVRACAQGLAAIHAQGILHRDIKPDNILMCPTRGPLLGDFGCARDLTGESVQTTQGAVLGTVPYLAPERVCGNPAVPASDVYSLGAMLYELLTGRLPFIHRDLGTILYMHMTAPIPRVRDTIPEVSEALDGLITRALAKTPETRIASAADMLRELERLAHGPETAQDASRPSVAPSAPRAARRLVAKETAPPPNARASRATVLATAAGAVLLGGTWWGLHPTPSPRLPPPPQRDARPVVAALSSAERAALVSQSTALMAMLLSTSRDMVEKHQRQDPRVDPTRFRAVILSIWTRLLLSLQKVFSAPLPVGPTLGDPELLLVRTFLAGRTTGADLTDIASLERMRQDPTESLNLAALARYQAGLDDFRRRGGEEVLRFLQRLPDSLHASQEPFVLAGLASLETLARSAPGAGKLPHARRHPVTTVARGLVPGLAGPGCTDPRNLLATESLLWALGEAGERSTALSLCEASLPSLRAASPGPRTQAWLQAAVMRLMLEARRLDLKADFRAYTASATSRAQALQEWKQLAASARVTLKDPAWRQFGRPGSAPAFASPPDLFQEGLRWSKYCDGQVRFLLRELGDTSPER